MSAFGHPGKGASSGPALTFVGGSNPLLYKHHRGECRFNGGMFGGMVRTLKTPSGMTGVGPSIERVQMFQSPSDVIQLDFDAGLSPHRSGRVTQRVFDAIGSGR